MHGSLSLYTLMRLLIVAVILQIHEIYINKYLKLILNYILSTFSCSNILHNKTSMKDSCYSVAQPIV